MQAKKDGKKYCSQQTEATLLTKTNLERLTHETLFASEFIKMRNMALAYLELLEIVKSHTAAKPSKKKQKYTGRGPTDREKEIYGGLR